MGDLFVFINLNCFILMLMIIWFKSSAFVEYCNLFGLKQILFGYDKDPTSLTFPQYLYIKSRTLFNSPIQQFIIALITCPLCLAFWLCVIVSSFYGSILFTPVFYIITVAGYFLISKIIE